jgi:hypothetical protein
MDDDTIRHSGQAAVVLALASVVLAPLNALARMRTESGQSDLDNGLAAWWAQPALDALTPRLLDFADPDTVYETYGKFYAIALVAVLACVFATRSLRPARQSWMERWGWRLTIASLVLMTAGQFVAYWIAVSDGAYLVVLLAMLIGVFGNILLGIGLLRGGFRPRFAAWVIVLDLPLSIGLVAISTQALGMWPTMLAWGVIGWSLMRRSDDNQTSGSPDLSERRRILTRGRFGQP